MNDKRVEDCIIYSGINGDVCPITKNPATQLNCFLCRPYFEETRVGQGLVHHDCHHPQFRSLESNAKREKE